eukprot:3840441-Pleurochrysis_carterae.AAC.1
MQLTVCRRLSARRVVCALLDSSACGWMSKATGFRHRNSTWAGRDRSTSATWCSRADSTRWRSQSRSPT